MNSLPSVEAVNLEAYWDIVRQLEPEFYIIKILLNETKVNPEILPKVIRGISNMSLGTGFGKVVIYMHNHKVTNIETVDQDRLDKPATIIRGELNEKI